MGLPNMALQRTRRPRLRSGRSLHSLGSPLNARLLDAGRELRRASWLVGSGEGLRTVAVGRAASGSVSPAVAGCGLLSLQGGGRAVRFSRLGAFSPSVAPAAAAEHDQGSS
jgi:hypothetical protein